MSKSPALRGHSGRTSGGNTRDVKVKKVGRVAIHKRVHTYFLQATPRNNPRSPATERPDEDAFVAPPRSVHSHPGPSKHRRP